MLNYLQKAGVYSDDKVFAFGLGYLSELITDRWTPPRRRKLGIARVAEDVPDSCSSVWRV